MVLTTLRSRLDPVVLVLGFEAERIRKALLPEVRDPKLWIADNPDYRQGIGTSISIGLSRVEALCDHVMIILADMPYITTATIDRLREGYLASGLSLGAVGQGERRLHPVVVGRRHYPRLHLLTGDRGARDLFREYPEEVCLVEPDPSYRNADIDTPEDYRAFRRTLEE
jgi:CTP:molybdopterin cytidylyltransferase MocA